MDSDDEEILAALMEEKADATDADEEHLLILASQAGLYAADAKSRCSGSVSGCRKSKQRQQAEGYCILYADYFIDDHFGSVSALRRL